MATLINNNNLPNQNILHRWGQLHSYRIGCVFPRFGLLCALAYYAQHYCDFIMMFIMRFGLLRAFGL